MSNAITMESAPVDTITPPPRSTLGATTTKPRGLFGRFTDIITLGGLSLLAFPLFLLVNSISPLALPDGRVATSVITLLTILTYAVNYPHYAATYARAYGERATIREYWRSTILVPIVLLALAALALAWPTTGVAWYFKAYLLLSGYHYSGQTYGVALIFAGQAKLNLTRTEKRVLMVPIYASWLYTIGLLESVSATPIAFAQEMMLAPIGLPIWVGDVGNVLLGLGAIAYVALNVKLYRRSGRTLPGVSHVVLLAHLTWFVAAPHSALYANFVPFFHCLQYLMVTTYFHMKGQQARSLDEHPTTVPTSLWKYYVGIVALGFLMYDATPLVIAGLGITSLACSTALVIAFINLHHFILDGEIWKLRKPQVKQTLVAA